MDIAELVSVQGLCEFHYDCNIIGNKVAYYPRIIDFYIIDQCNYEYIIIEL